MTQSKHPQNNVKKAVIPAAGLGTRLHPVTKTIPKELLPVLDKPLIDYVMEEALTAELDEILVIIRPGKESIAEHLASTIEEISQNIVSPRSLDDEDANSKNTEHRPTLNFVYQHQQKGLGHAIACSRSFVGDDPFAVLLADNITKSPGDNVISQLLSAFEETGSTVIALEKVAEDKTGNYGIADVEAGKNQQANLLNINDLVEKPTPGEAPSNYAIASRYVFPASLFSYLDKTPPGKKNEIQVTDAVRLMLEDMPVKGLEFEGKRYDIGNRLDYLRTIMAFASDNPEFDSIFRNLQL